MIIGIDKTANVKKSDKNKLQVGKNIFFVYPPNPTVDIRFNLWSEGKSTE